MTWSFTEVDQATRERIIARTSGLGIAVNILLAAIKVVAGLCASSIAIVSEGVNNAADALTSALTYVGSKLAARHPDAQHPFGYGRVEYLSALAVSIVVLVSGAQVLSESVRLIFNPEKLAISYVSLAIVAVSSVVKFALGLYTIRRGKAVSSDALVGVGAESRSDAFVSVITIVTAVVFLTTGFSIDAYAGLLMSAVILKTGFDVLKKTVAELIGRPGQRELAEKIYSLVRATPGVAGAADMMLHNYGPDAWSGSVNVEIDHARSVGETYAFLHQLQLKIMHELRVTMVFGVYAVDNDHPASIAIRRAVGAFVRDHRDVVRGFHAIYLEPGTDRLYCDLVVTYELRDWDALRAEFTTYITSVFPAYAVELTIETDFV